MTKALLETFIDRYNLGNLIPKTKWKYTVADKTLHTRAAADNRSFIVDVIMHDFTEFGDDDVVVCIGDTEKVSRMMSPFGDDIKLTLNKSGDRILGFTISDSDCESYCTAADPSAMDPVAKNLNIDPEYHVVIPLTDEFLDKFLKARAALKDVDSFSIGMNKKGLFEVVIGYTTANSNRIRICPATDPVKNTINTALSFPVNNVAAVLKANSDIPNGTMSINSDGLIAMNFKNDKFSCTYYQFIKTKKV